MRVALVTDGIWPYVLGGMQKHSYYLCKYLAREKVQVDLYHFNQSDYDILKLEFFTEEERAYIRAFVVDFPSGPSFPGHYLYRSYQYSKAVYHALEEQLHQYQYIYCKGFTAWYLLNQKQKNHEKTFPPIGIKFHGYEMFQRAPDVKTKLQHVLLLRAPVKSLSKKADHVYSYGGKITDIIRRLGVDPAKIVELPSGVEQSVLAPDIRPSGKPLRILFLGRYERRKGIQEFNKAIIEFQKTSDDVALRFHFIGPIPEQQRLQSPLVTYHGEIRNKQTLTNLIRENDVLMCPSWSEGMPNVILEAMANGLCVAATDVGATAVLVNEQTGWLLNSSDPSEILNCLYRIANTSSAVINAKKEAAQQHIAQHFTWEKLIAGLLKVIT